MPEDQQTTPRPLGAPAARAAAAAAAEQDRIRAEAEAIEKLQRELDAGVDETVEMVTEGPPPLVPEPDAGSTPDPDPPADEEAARPNLAGKRVVLYAKTGAAGWIAVSGSDGPLLYEGDRDTAVTAALDDERNTKLADMVRADPARFLLVSVPASSWAPAPVKPKVTKTTWTVVR